MSLLFAAAVTIEDVFTPIMTNIWQRLKAPFLVLAPMEGVTDTVFRRVINRCGRPDISFTEFTNVEGMNSVGRAAVEQNLSYSPEERPLIAQIWGLEPLHYEKAAEEIVRRGFDGVDINFGCPERNVVKKGACSAMINTPDLAVEIIKATKKGVRGKIPVSVKTRIGFKTIETEKWVSLLLEQEIDALTIHGRTAKDKSLVPNRWEEIEKAVAIRNRMKSGTIMIGNGDVTSRDEAIEKCKQYGVDGIMIGRGVFKDPFVFHPTKSIHQLSPLERLELLEFHIHLFENTWGKTKNYEILKRFYKIYMNGFVNAQNVRVAMMDTYAFEEIKPLVKTIASTLASTGDVIQPVVE